MKKSPAENKLEELYKELDSLTKVAERTNFESQHVIDELESILTSIKIIKGVL